MKLHWWGWLHNIATEVHGVAGRCTTVVRQSDLHDRTPICHWLNVDAASLDHVDKVQCVGVWGPDVIMIKHSRKDCLHGLGFLLQGFSFRHNTL